MPHPTPSALGRYVRLIPADELKAIMKPELSDEALLSIAAALQRHVSAPTAEWAAGWLAALAGVGRFDMTVLMLDAKAKKQLAAMFDAVEAHHAGASKLRARYGLK